VTRVSSEVVFRRVRGTDGITTIERTFVWRFEESDGQVVRRTLIDPGTGEVLDDAWLDEHGRVQVYEAPAIGIKSARPE